MECETHTRTHTHTEPIDNNASYNMRPINARPVSRMYGCIRAMIISRPVDVDGIVKLLLRASLLSYTNTALVCVYVCEYRV